MLTQNQLNVFRTKLRDRYYELREEIRLELLKSDNESFIKLAGQVHDLEEESVADLLTDLQYSNIDRHIQEIRDIEAALLRIASGGYGTCTDCGGEIDLERLTAYPTAKRCHKCQVLYEKTHAPTGRPTL